MSELYELYQQVILDHNKKPRNYHKMEHPSKKSEGFNPLCGDRLTVYVQMEGDQVRDISFEGSGCAISKASASMMTESLKGKTRAEAEELFKNFHAVLTGQNEEAVDEDKMGKLVVFSGVREFPVRVKCATLPWHTFHAALEGEENKTVSTE